MKFRTLGITVGLASLMLAMAGCANENPPHSPPKLGTGVGTVGHSTAMPAAMVQLADVPITDPVLLHRRVKRSTSTADRLKGWCIVAPLPPRGPLPAQGDEESDGNLDRVFIYPGGNDNVTPYFMGPPAMRQALQIQKPLQDGVGSVWVPAVKLDGPATRASVYVGGTAPSVAVDTRVTAASEGTAFIVHRRISKDGHKLNVWVIPMNDKNDSDKVVKVTINPAIPPDPDNMVTYDVPVGRYWHAKFTDSTLDHKRVRRLDDGLTVNTLFPEDDDPDTSDYDDTKDAPRDTDGRISSVARRLWIRFRKHLDDKSIP